MAGIQPKVNSRGRSKEAEEKTWQFPSISERCSLYLAVHENQNCITGSATMERMFIIAGDVHRPKRAIMICERFEKPVFTKGNVQLLLRCLVEKMSI